MAALLSPEWSRAWSPRTRRMETKGYERTAVNMRYGEIPPGEAHTIEITRPDKTKVIIRETWSDIDSRYRTTLEEIEKRKQ